MKLKPFDIQKAISGSPVVDSTGLPAEYLTTTNNSHSGISYWFKLGAGSDQEGVTTFDSSGKTKRADVKQDQLFMAPQKKTVWVNMWETKYGGVTPRDRTFESEESALAMP